MRTTIDKAGRLVIPKALRDHLGLVPGEVDVEVDGAALRVQPVCDLAELTDENGRLVIAPTGTRLSADTVGGLIDEDRARGDRFATERDDAGSAG